MNLVNFYANQTNIAAPKPDCKEKIKLLTTGIYAVFFLTFYGSFIYTKFSEALDRLDLYDGRHSFPADFISKFF
jgi:hypothetical protein